MKTFSRILSLLLTFVLAGSLLVGCTQPEPAEDPETQTTEPPAQQDDPVADEYTIPLEDGCNQVTFYWSYPGDYETCDMWIWYGDKAGQGYPFHSCSYGGKVVVNIPEDVEQLGFIVRRDCSDPGGSEWGSAVKDYEQDRFAEITGRETVIYLQTEDANQYISNDGGKTLEMTKKFTIATLMDEKTIGYKLSPKTTIDSLDQVKVFCGDREVEVVTISSLGKESASGSIELKEELDLSAQYRVEIQGYGEKDAIPMEIFDSQYFADRFHYDGDDLGAVIHGNQTTFKVWAPTASRVVLNLFTSGHEGDAYKTVDMVLGEKGVWSWTEDCGHGTYYTYTVTTSVGTQEAVDPYAKAAGLNGNRGMVVDLSQTDPEGWENAGLENPIENYSEAIIWEVHVRDFSNKIESSQYKGKYLAFTETGLVNEYGESVGIDYLKKLGITHVHLLPVYDYATVDEGNPDGEFNWGYDPKNYNVPEGSYSTDPYNGEVRIREYKQMVMALHEAGIGVVMDMVYNHTYDGNSSFNKIVPYYYYRYTSSGANSSASGCGNDTASERYMFGKFMVDSTSYWVEEYQLDGLRFDLMGLHDLDTMQEVETAVHSVNPNAILYGEGWTMGATIDGSLQANQTNISKIQPAEDAIGGIAVFNDVIRDGLKGSVFEKTGRGYINGSGVSVKKVLFGMQGGEGMGQGWSVENAMVINYMSAHDNNTLWDKLLLSNPDSTVEQRNRMNNLGAAIILVSRGTPFWQAGEEMLRTKDGDENSYKSSDAINNIDWSALQPGTDAYNTMLYYSGLIEMRKSFAIFTDPSAKIVDTQELGSGILAVTFDDGNGGQALVVVNPHNTDLPYTLTGNWNLVADGERAGSQVLARESGNISVQGISLRVYVNDALAR